jgi:hypothetical protein
MNTIKTILPSGAFVVIREQTGADDEILSSLGNDASDLFPLNKFIHGILVSYTYPGSSDPSKLTLQEFLKLPIRDKYYILIKSRIFSLGPDVEFQYSFNNPEAKDDFIEDLNKFCYPTDTEIPEELSEGMIKPYSVKVGEPIYIELSDNRVARFTLLDGYGEMMSNDPKNAHYGINLELYCRKLEIKQGNDFVPVRNFQEFSARTMAQIRGIIRKVDPALQLVTDVQHPMTGEIIEVPLLGLPDFFFPTLP